MNSYSNIQYRDNGMMKMIRTTILQLRREQNAEILYTGDGQKIPLDDIVSLNGHFWA